MKFSFSTLGCPDWSFSEILSVAKDLSFDGVEIRGIAEKVYVPEIKVFSENNINKTRAELISKNMEICCLSSTCLLNFKDDRCMKEAREYIDKANLLSCSYVRVLGEERAEPSEDYNDSLFIERLKILCDYAAKKNVTVLIENNGVYADSNRLMDIVGSVSKNNLGVIWDIQHSVRNYGENIEYTYNMIKSRLCHVHIKDSAVVNGRNVYTMIGKGTLPVKELILLLKDKGFDGYLSLEWLKRYYSDLEDAGIVFSRYISLVKSFI